MTERDEWLISALAMLSADVLGDAEAERRVTRFQDALRLLRDDPAEAARIDALVMRPAADGITSHRQLTVPAVVRGREISRTAHDALDTSQWLAVSGPDLRVMHPGDREETEARITQLRELLHCCPAGAFGEEATAAVLARVTTLSEALIANRDERAALRLIEAASPQLVLLGRHHPATFGVRRAHAGAWCELGRYRRAGRMLRRLSEDERQVFGADDSRTALLLLWALAGSNRLPEATAGFDALSARLDQPQADRTLMLHLQCRSSWVQGLLGLSREAELGYDEVITGRSSVLKDYDHADVNDARHSKGKMLVLTGQGPRAVTLLQAVADDRARIQGDRHPDTLETQKYLELARVLTEPRDDRVLNDAINNLEQIKRIQYARHGPGYPMSRDTAEQLGQLRLLREAVRLRETIPDLWQAPIPGQSPALQQRAHSVPEEIVR